MMKNMALNKRIGRNYSKLAEKKFCKIFGDIILKGMYGLQLKFISMKVFTQVCKLLLLGTDMQAAI